MLGTGAGYISQAAMIDAMVPLFKAYKKGRRPDEKIDWPVFNTFFMNKDMQAVIQNLYDYFLYLHIVFRKEGRFPQWMAAKQIMG